MDFHPIGRLRVTFEWKALRGLSFLLRAKEMMKLPSGMGTSTELESVRVHTLVQYGHV